MKMKKKLLWALLLFCSTAVMNAESLSSLTWAQVCAGRMGDEWYGSAEAQQVADVVLYVQKTNGGWMKNDQLHKLTETQKQTLYNQRGEHSCLDNTATTQEMRFLAKVWQKTQVTKYQTAFLKGLNMIFKAEKGCGGWSQYWPLAGGGSYWDYITFNDDLMTNVMKLLRDIADNQGDFKDIASEATRQKCEKSFQHAIEIIIKCQVDDNGTPAAWCAQHDTVTLLPTEGRPHELPSVSGSESSSLLSFLMTIENPSKELQNTIHTAVAWLDAHKIEGKAIENFTNADGESDRRVIDKAGSAIWGRFIQLGGESGRKTYEAFFTKLKNRNKTRSYTWNGKTYNYKEYEIATTSYNPEKAYQPIYAIYDNNLAHLFYRFLYYYEDHEPEVDSKGVPVLTSLNAARRTSYQFLGSWCLNMINTEYPAWKQRMEEKNESEGYNVYALNQSTFTGSATEGSATVYNFSGGISVSNVKGKGYAAGTSATKTVKYSAGVEYTITLPQGMKAQKVKFYGYDNYADADAYISKCNGKTFAATEYVFPAKDSNNTAILTANTVDFGETPATDNITFTLGGKQCALTISLYEPDGTVDILTVRKPENSSDILYDLNGHPVSDGKAAGICVKDGRKIFFRK